jgi:hypothetical protein
MFKHPMIPVTQTALAVATVLALNSGTNTTALAGTAAKAPAESPIAAPIEVSIEAGSEGDRVTYSAPGARLDRILGAIAEAAGFKLAIRGDLSRPAQAIRMSTVPLDRAIRRLAGNTSMVMIFDPENSGGRRVAEVRLYARP